MFEPTAPNFDDPIGVLRACHKRILDFCKLLERMPPHQAQHGADRSLQQAAERVLRYFDIAAPLHHQDEEQDLFPLLEESHLRDLLRRLRLEHTQHEQLWETLAPALRQIQQGTGVATLATQIAPFVAAMRQHIEIENDQVLPFASSELSTERLQRIGQAMAARRGR